jgi:predicted nuclease with TOPRIM domain
MVTLYSDPKEGIVAIEGAMGIDAILALAKKHETLMHILMEEQIMHERLQTRLSELKNEFEKGRARLQELEKEQMHLRETMLRISGAVQILEELLNDEHVAKQNGVGLVETSSITGQSNSISLETVGD